MEDDMKITELLNESGIELGVSVKDKSSAIEILVNLHEKAGNLSDKAEYTQAIKAREEQGSTAVGEGIAIPHAKCSAVKDRDLQQLQYRMELIMKHLTDSRPICFL